MTDQPARPIAFADLSDPHISPLRVEPADGDARDLGARVARIQEDVLLLAAIAVSVRDSERLRLDALSAELTTAAAKLSAFGRTPEPPAPTVLAEWAARETARLVSARDGFPVLPGVELGSLRAWLSERAAWLETAPKVDAPETK